MWEIPIELKRMLDVPVITDISHICGNRELLRDTAQKSVDLAFDGLMVECHCAPQHALTDADQQITPDALKTVLGTLSYRSRQATGDDPVLAALRTEIDDIDDELLQLLARRMNVASQIGEYKKQKGLTVVQMERWKQILADHLETGAELGLSQELIIKVFEAIHLASIQRQS
jgi:chorismate mutase